MSREQAALKRGAREPAQRKRRYESASLRRCLGAPATPTPREAGMRPAANAATRPTPWRVSTCNRSEVAA